MPRAKIMKICYIILDKLKPLPSDAMYRIYTEEKIKYIMRNTDETEDIRTLEEILGIIIDQHFDFNWMLMKERIFKALEISDTIIDF